ncbi:ABC1 kinase family protein [Nocardia vulneris]|uniref:ABC transporter ATP-binding protein n=1 Tax=Nocardia vulneris TaxID=1141657 RepID=A0ABR4ZMF2_9NOCA|nr:AarF/ABC1/UbiB kinase family protein [Nocardia vulneris]KIA66522.1 ABC transporter ATP-binding protein [Nocardia vulneris]
MAGSRRTGLARSAKLAKLPMSIMARRVTATGRAMMTGASRGELDDELIDKAADQVFAVLGELKGGAMKLGQALSVAEASIPPRFADRYREALTRLQAQAPPMPTAAVHRMLTEQLGTRWRERFTSFDDRPVAAASIGQVHRAVWRDGRDVAVKVQYPGADTALLSDLKMLQMFSGAFGLMMPGADTKALIAEFIDRTADELDYRIEADHQRRFAREFADDPHFQVPRVIASAPKVLVSEWLQATPLSAIIANGSKAQRDRAGARLVEFSLSAPVRVGYLHCDPHPGNFQLLDDGRLGVIDFGASIALPTGIPAVIGELGRCAVQQDYDQLVRVMRDHGFVRPGHELELGPIERLVAPIVAQINGDSVHISRELLQGHTARALDRKNVSLVNTRAVKAPTEIPELAMLGRVFAGVVGVCAQLDAEGPFLESVARWLPGFAADGAAA